MDFLCLDFINTRWSGRCKAAPAGSRERLRSFCLNRGLSQIVEAEIEELLELREFMFEAGRALCLEKKLAPPVLSRLNALLAAAPLCKRLAPIEGGYRLEETPAHAGAGGLIFRIALSFAELASNHSLNRLKMCENRDCGWIFYDTSKSGGRIWCDNSCASLLKVRRFRAKKRGAAN